MGVRWSGSLVHLIEAAEQRQAYNHFRKVRTLYAKLVARSPVLAGDFRAAWKAGYGKPTYRYRRTKDKREGMPPRSAPAFNLEYDRDRAWHMYITNGAPYAVKLEAGDSRQAPMGILRISILEVFGGH